MRTPSASQTTIPVLRPVLPNAEALAPYIAQIDASGLYSNFGPLVRQLEARLARRFRIGADQAVTTSNGTSALQISYLIARNAAPENARTCLMPSWTFAATAHAAVAAGLEPYFLDVDPVSQQLTPKAVAAALDDLDPDDVAAVAVVSPFGAPVDVKAWEDFQDATGITVIIDAAAAYVTTQASRVITCLSLHATKILPAGEGGLILCPDSAIARSARQRSNFGFWKSRIARAEAINAKMSEYHAAIALATLDQWPARRAEHARVCQSLRAAFDPLPGVHFLPGFGDDWFNINAVATLDAPDASGYKSWLETCGVATRRWWGPGCHRQEAFLDYDHAPLPVTESLSERVLGLPCHLQLSDADIAVIASATSDFLSVQDETTGRQATA